MHLAVEARKAIPAVKNDSQIDSQTTQQTATSGDTPEQPFLRLSSTEAQ